MFRFKHIKEVAGAATEGKCFLPVTPQRTTMTVCSSLSPDSRDSSEPASSQTSIWTCTLEVLVKNQMVHLKLFVAFGRKE